MNNNQNNINRKDALKKIGKYSALTALGTFLILNPKTSQATSGLLPRSAPDTPESLIND